MNIDAIFELTWVPIIVFGVCLGYGIVLVATKDPKLLISRKDPKPVKNAAKYAMEGGKLFLFLASGSFIMCILLFINVILAFAEICLWFCVFAVLWKRVSGLYGPI